MKPHKGWHSRGYLPHCDQPGKIQSVTIRLHDSMPAARRAEWAEFLQRSGSDSRLDAIRRKKIEAYLDAGHGACSLRIPAIAAMVEEGLLHWDGGRYRLLAWVLMPNHLHVAFEMESGWPLGEVMRRFKSHTAQQANRLLGREGQFWYPDYWDRYIRDTKHLQSAIRYIHQNPVKAGLVRDPAEWRWSSARRAPRETTRPIDHEGKF